MSPNPDFPTLSAIAEDAVEVLCDGQGRRLSVGDSVGVWTLMGITRGMALFEDFSQGEGAILVLGLSGVLEVLPKSQEATFADPETLYRGHSLQQVLESDHDLLGNEILAEPGDPDYSNVAACVAPIVTMATHSFVGTRECPDKVGIAYGGRSPNFDPAVYVPAIEAIRKQGRVLDGLVGGWLPALRFVYPEGKGDWTEMVMFAPLRTENPRIQPVWYRVCRVEGNALKWARYFDTYHPAPPRTAADPAGFYSDLVALREGWGEVLKPGIRLEIPDRRLADLVRHSLVRAMITRVGDFPKYGVMDRNYGASEHDGFQDTFNVETTAMLEWGQFDAARDYLDNYLTYFVRDDGSIVYRGSETGQYGRMLTVIAQFANYTGDSELLLKHRVKIDAIAQLLLDLRREAKTLPEDDPGYGLIAGWCEADSCLEPDPGRYVLPYFSNSSEAVRGLAELGRVWERVGDSEVAAWGARLQRESRELSADLQTAIGRSTLKSVPCIPAVAGMGEPLDTVTGRDAQDPQFRAYRAYMEMLFSGCLTRAQVETIFRYRESHRDVLLGVPGVYGFNSGEMGGFLSYGHGYGLLQHDFVREFLLTLYSLSAHQYTRGTWTAPETRRIDPEATAAPYCTPAQLAVPLLVRWMLAFEDPLSETLWLCKGTPRDWLGSGQTVAATNMPTRWGRAGFRIRSGLDRDRVEATLDLPGGHATILRLRVPGGRRIASVSVNGEAWEAFNARDETVTLSEGVGGRVEVVVAYVGARADR